MIPRAYITEWRAQAPRPADSQVEQDLVISRALVEIRKTRPAVIVSEDAIGILPLRVVVPLTEWRDRYEIAPWLVRVQPDEDNNLDEPSAADALQIRSVSRTRFVSRLGQVTTADLESIVGASRSSSGHPEAGGHDGRLGPPISTTASGRT